MLALEERFMIRELYRKGVSISEIARRTGRDRKTIRHIATAPDLSPPKPQRQAKPCKIDAYAPYLERRIAEGVLNARKLYAEILAQGYPGKESKVREFVHDRRPEQEPSGSIRFETAPGEQGQVDWGHFGFITHQGRTCRLYAFVMTLGWSRACYVRFTTSSDTTWFIRCHLHAFAYLGGVPRHLLYDNLKSVVERRDADDMVHWNPRFLDFADVAGFSPQACKPYRPQTNDLVAYCTPSAWLACGLIFVNILHRSVLIGWREDCHSMIIEPIHGKQPCPSPLHEGVPAHPVGCGSLISRQQAPLT